jgi:hypothetical protein
LGIPSPAGSETGAPLIQRSRKFLHFRCNNGHRIEQREVIAGVMKAYTCLVCGPWLVALWVGAVSTYGATLREWVAHGTGSGNWSEPGNWSPAGVPQNGDDLIFHATAEEPSPRLDMNNDLVDLHVRRFEFCGHSWTLGGNELTLNEYVDRERDGFCGASSIVFTCPLKLGDSTRMNIGWGSIILRGNIDLNGNDLKLVSGDQIIVSGQITGTGNVFATIDAYTERENSLTFDGPTGNTFSGKLTVRRLYQDKGEVVFDKQSGVVVNDALLIGERSSFIEKSAVCRLARSHQIGDTAEVCVTGGSQFLLDGHTETIGSLCLTNHSGDTQPTLVDTGGSTLSVQGDITAVNDSLLVVPTIRGKLGLPGPVAASPTTKKDALTKALLQRSTTK